MQAASLDFHISEELAILQESQHLSDYLGSLAYGRFKEKEYYDDK